MSSVLKQTSWLLSAQVLTKIVGFVYTIYLARNLGVANFGLFSAALAYFSLLSSVADFGFNRFFVRELANQKYNTSELLANTGILRLTITSVVFGIFSLVLYMFDPDKLRASLSTLAILAVVPLSINQSIDAVFVALRKLEYSAIALLILSASSATAGVYLVSSGFGAMGPTIALVFGQMIYLLSLLYFLKVLRVGFLAQVRWNILKNIITGSLPYGILAVMGLIYFKIDTLMLTYLRGNFDTGIYNAAYRFLEAVIFIPSAMGTALFPVMVKLHEENVTQIKKAFFDNIRILFLLSLILVLGYVTILPLIIKTFLPNYLSSISVIKILALSIPFIFFHVPAASVIVSAEKYLNKIILLSLIPLMFNIILNFIFIPRFGFIGAAWVTVASDVLSFLLIYIFIQKFIFLRITDK